MDTLNDWLSTILVFISILLPIVYLKGFRKHGVAYDIFTFYLYFIAIIQFVASLYVYEKVTNTFLFHYYFIGQFIFMSIFYYQLLKLKLIYYILGIGLLLLTIHYVINPSIFYEYHTYGVSLTQSVIVLYALIYYYVSLTKKSTFLYVNTGVLLYFLTSILFFASMNFILALDIPKEVKQNISIINEVLYFVFQIFIFIEWYKNYRKPSLHT